MEEITRTGLYLESDISLFFTEYEKLINKFHRKQEKIAKQVDNEIAEANARFKDEWKQSTSRSRFMCPRCSARLPRRELKQHLATDHPFPKPPSINNIAYPKWYREYILHQARFNYMKNMLIYVPLGGQP